MSETQSTTDANATETKAAATDPQQKQGDPAEPLGENGVKALKAERDRAKDLEKQLTAATARLTEIERANESALEKAQREAQEAREAANQSAIDALRFRIAAETGITDNVDLILTAGDEDTMRKQATLWASRTPESTAPAGPRPDLTQGGSGQPHALNSDGLEEALRSKLGIA